MSRSHLGAVLAVVVLAAAAVVALFVWTGQDGPQRATADESALRLDDVTPALIESAPALGADEPFEPVAALVTAADPDDAVQEDGAVMAVGASGARRRLVLDDLGGTSVGQAAISDDGRRVAFLAADQAYESRRRVDITMWDPTTGATRRTRIPLSIENVIGFDQTGRRLLVGGPELDREGYVLADQTAVLEANGTVRVLDLAYPTSWTPDGQIVAAQDPHGHGLLDPRTGSTQPLADGRDVSDAPSMSPDGTLLLSESQDSQGDGPIRPRAYDARTGDEQTLDLSGDDRDTSMTRRLGWIAPHTALLLDRNPEALADGVGIVGLDLKTGRLRPVLTLNRSLTRTDNQVTVAGNLLEP